ncbi:hypothetical protein ASE80_02940 [Pseudomonas sp. Leaf15]|nr:hypothetical protein ASE80_02940 [Pseudomonas sp. Leaf15]RAH03579.1 hypothetical protein DJ480_03835 [Pseudomonas sp. Leaf98]
MSVTSFPPANGISHWSLLLQDHAGLMRRPGAHHRLLVNEAHALHRQHLIGRDELSDLLELADGALAYAVEALLDERQSD